MNIILEIQPRAQTRFSTSKAVTFPYRRGPSLARYGAPAELAQREEALYLATFVATMLITCIGLVLR